MAFHFIEQGKLNAFLLCKKNGGRKTPLKFKLECIDFSLATASAEHRAAEASDRFSGRHFPEVVNCWAKHLGGNPNILAPPTGSWYHGRKTNRVNRETLGNNFNDKIGSVECE